MWGGGGLSDIQSCSDDAHRRAVVHTNRDPLCAIKGLHGLLYMAERPFHVPVKCSLLWVGK